MTGVFLAMHHTPHVDLAFNSVEHIMRDVEGGWLLRYMHANGASMFLIVVHLHIFRGLYHASYSSPREFVRCLGRYGSGLPYLPHLVSLKSNSKWTLKLARYGNPRP